jgi:hypothetical protein
VSAHLTLRHNIDFGIGDKILMIFSSEKQKFEVIILPKNFRERDLSVLLYSYLLRPFISIVSVFSFSPVLSSPYFSSAYSHTSSFTFTSISFQPFQLPLTQPPHQVSTLVLSSLSSSFTLFKSFPFLQSTYNPLSFIVSYYVSKWGHAVALRHCATNRKVTGSIPIEVTGFFN